VSLRGGSSSTPSGQGHPGSPPESHHSPRARRPLAAPRRNDLLATALCAAASVLACRTPPDPTTPKSERVNTELLDQLIDSSALDPVDEAEFGDEEVFAELEAEYAKRGPGAAAPPPTQDAASAEETLAALLGREDTTPQEVPYNPYLEFGRNIYPYDDDRDGKFDRVMKPFYFPSGMGEKTLQLLKVYGDFEIHRLLRDGQEQGEGVPAEVQPPGSVVLDLHPGGLVESLSDPRDPKNPNGGMENKTALGDILYVTAEPELIREIEQFIQVFAASPRQIEVAAKIVEVATNDSLDLGIVPVDADTPTFGLPDHTFVRAIDLIFPNTSSSANSLFRFSSIHDGLVFNAVLEAVASNENVSIISRPKVAVREGGRAEILNTQQIPFYNIQSLTAAGTFSAGLSYQEVGIKMYVIPRIVGNDTVVLNIDIEASQESGTAITFVQDQLTLSIPVISSRTAKTTVYLEPGQAVILGGLISERSVERTKKVPFLGDVPLLGFFFRSRFTEKRQVNVLFFIRPRILQGSDLNRPFE